MDLSFYYWCTDPCYCLTKHTCNENTIIHIGPTKFSFKNRKTFQEKHCFGYCKTVSSHNKRKRKGFEDVIDYFASKMSKIYEGPV